MTALSTTDADRTAALEAAEAAALTKSWSNRQAIEEFVINAA